MFLLTFYNLYADFFFKKNVFIILGPDFWGLLNLEWSLCSKGRRQSPVDIDPAGLLYDPSLRPLHVDKIRVRTNFLDLIYLIHNSRIYLFKEKILLF